MNWFKKIWLKILSWFSQDDEDDLPEPEPDRKVDDRKDVGDPVETKPRLPSLYWELADKIDHRLERNRFFPAGKAEFVVIHFSAGRNNPNGLINYLKSKGYGVHFVITKEGEIWQTLPMNQFGSHAGKSAYDGRTSLNSKSIGIEILCGGSLKEKNGKYYRWFDKKNPVSPSDYRQITKKKDNHVVGTYEKFTADQEDALFEVVSWITETQGIPIDRVIGHDECATPRGRKTDPGPSLSFTMPEFREEFKK